MFSKISIIVSAALASTLVVAAPHGSDNDGINNSCNTGPVQCCNQLVDNNAVGIATLSSFIGILNGIDSFSGPPGQIGADCTPMGVVSALNGVKCDAHPVCCKGNTFNGLINIGCSPVTL